MYERKQIEGFPNYSVDTDGNVWSNLKRTILQGPLGRTLGIAMVASSKWGKLKPGIGKKGNGYYQLHLYKDGERHIKRINRLVAKAFIPNPESKPFACHKDGDRFNNHADNLYWGTAAENTADMMRHGTAAGFLNKGEAHGMAKLNETRVRFIRRAVALGVNQGEIAKMLKISRSTVTDIKKGRSWTFLKHGWEQHFVTT